MLWTYVVLLMIIVYTFGFGITLWKEKQKLGAFGVFFLCLTIIALHLFTMIY